MIANAVYSLLTGDAAVTALVVKRVFPNVAPQGVKTPYIVYQLVTVLHVEVLAGSAQTARSLVQVGCWSPDYDESRDLAEKVRRVLQGFSGTQSSIQIDGVNLTGDLDRYNPPRHADEPGMHGVQMDFAVWHQEATAA